MADSSSQKADIRRFTCQHNSRVERYVDALTSRRDQDYHYSSRMVTSSY